MHIRTIEEDFEYQMKGVITKFRKDYNLKDLDAEEFQEKVWKDKNLSVQFGRAIIEACNDYSGDELFEKD